MGITARRPCFPRQGGSKVVAPPAIVGSGKKEKKGGFASLFLSAPLFSLFSLANYERKDRGYYCLLREFYLVLEPLPASAPSWSCGEAGGFVCKLS